VPPVATLAASDCASPALPPVPGAAPSVFPDKLLFELQATLIRIIATTTLSCFMGNSFQSKFRLTMDPL
jgi:hypothetical protein